MHSRSYLLLQRDLEYMTDNPVWGIDAGPESDADMYVWRAQLNGPRGTDWEEGTFQLRLKFSHEYNAKPPQVIFMTIPFHPNIDMNTGKPCVDFLDDSHSWDEGRLYGVQSILIAIQNLLSNPNVENAVNSHAAYAYHNSPRTYKQMVLDCVYASKRVAAGLPAYSELEDDAAIQPESGWSSLSPPPPPTTAAKSVHVSKVSFEEYHAMWKGLATSVSSPQAPAILFPLMKKDRALRAAHYGSDTELTQRVEQYLELKYGRPSMPQDSRTAAHKEEIKRRAAQRRIVESRIQDPKQFRHKRMQLLAELYNKSTTPPPATETETETTKTTSSIQVDKETIPETPSSSSSREVDDSDDRIRVAMPDVDAEADELTAWTEGLTEDALNT